MARQIIVNSPTGSGLGDTLPGAMDKINSMTLELYGDVENLQTSLGENSTSLNSVIQDITVVQDDITSLEDVVLNLSNVITSQNSLITIMQGQINGLLNP